MTSETLHLPDVLSGLTIHTEGGALRSIRFGDAPPISDSGPLVREVERQLREFLGGTRKTFDVPLDLRGTAFQVRVWRALMDIPYGSTASYRDIATAVGCPRGFQAIGQANHHNPIPIIVPCHRVIAANGSIGGYGGGRERKQLLLDLERGGGRLFESAAGD
ncbi:MAG: methylated-DNA--[protein]-cysteine S-methyltransferase [Terriglobia bacterium]